MSHHSYLQNRSTHTIFLMIPFPDPRNATSAFHSVVKISTDLCMAVCVRMISTMTPTLPASWLSITTRTTKTQCRTSEQMERRYPSHHHLILHASNPPS